MLFEYAIVHFPRETKEDKDAGRAPVPVILQDVKRVVAQSEAEVQTRAAREIPETYLDKLDTISLVVRPF
jgi:hypothetical protein